jgi:hypothetical protein
MESLKKQKSFDTATSSKKNNSLFYFQREKNKLNILDKAHKK